MNCGAVFVNSTDAEKADLAKAGATAVSQLAPESQAFVKQIQALKDATPPPAAAAAAAHHQDRGLRPPPGSGSRRSPARTQGETREVPHRPGPRRGSGRCASAARLAGERDVTSTTQPGAAATRPPPGPLARGLEFCARWLEVYSQAAAADRPRGHGDRGGGRDRGPGGRTSSPATCSATRSFGAEELARFAFLLGDLARGVAGGQARGGHGHHLRRRRRARLVAALGAHLRRGQPGGAAGLRLLRARPSTRTGQFASRGSSPSLGMPWFYPVVSMAIGYYFITLHYLAAVAGRRGAAGDRGERGPAPRGPGAGRGGRDRGGGLARSSTACWRSARRRLIALGVIFVALTLAGTPIVFMLSIVGIIAFLPSFLGLSSSPARTRWSPSAPPSRRWA